MDALVIDFRRARKAAEDKQRAAKRAKPTKKLQRFYQKRDAVRMAARVSL